jgi:hypothetical protein
VLRCLSALLSTGKIRDLLGADDELSSVSRGAVGDCWGRLSAYRFVERL